MSHRAPVSREKTVPRDPIARVIVAILRLVFGLIFVLLFSIVIQLFMAWWTEDGSAYSRSLLNQEVSFLGSDFKSSAWVSDSSQLANDVIAKTNSLFASVGVLPLLDWIGQRMSRVPDITESNLQIRIRQALVSVGDYLIVVAVALQLFAVRLTILVLALPIFLLFGLVGLADGLARRDLRRWGGGRESGFIYHHAKRFVFSFFVIAWLAYLLSPWSLNPGAILVPCAALFGLVVAIAAAKFKKYL